MPSSAWKKDVCRSEEHTSELQSLTNIVCRLLLEKNTQQFPIVGEQHELAGVFIGQPDAILLIEADGMREFEQSGAPRRLEIAVPIKDHHGMFVGSVEAEHSVSGVDRDRRRPHVDTLRNA